MITDDPLCSLLTHKMQNTYEGLEDTWYLLSTAVMSSTPR